MILCECGDGVGAICTRKKVWILKEVSDFKNL